MKEKTTFIWTMLLFATTLIGCWNANDENVNQSDNKVICKCFLDSVKTDTLQIEVKRYGCEPIFSDQLFIYKNNDSLFAELAIIGYDKEILSKIKSLMVDSSKTEYANFEKNGKTYMNDGPSSTVQTVYKIKLNSDTLEFMDYRNEFDSYEKMKNKVFGLTNMGNLRKKIYH